MKFDQTVHHCDGGKKWLDFGDLDLIFKITPALWNSNFYRKSLSAHYLLNQWLEFAQLAQIHQFDGEKLLDFGDLDLIFKITTL